jgi:hypothetical protein
MASGLLALFDDVAAFAKIASSALCNNCDPTIFGCKTGRLDEENSKDVCLMWAKHI